MAVLPLSVAGWDYDRTRALLDGRVPIEGCDAVFSVMTPEECFHRAWMKQQFDVTELGLCTYLTVVSRGVCPYIAIPAFVSRAFRHGAIFVRDDRGIEQPSDLRDKRIGVPFFEMAAAVWVRGFLWDDYGITAADIVWYQGGLEEPGQRPRAPLNLPDSFPLHNISPTATLSQMLADGELDGIVTARSPSCFDDSRGAVRRLFPDYRVREIDYFQRTGIFPIMHVVGVRKTLVELHPWLPAAVFAAYLRAKRIADADLQEVVAPKISLPWIAAEMEATQKLMGADFWSYGVPSNLATLQAASRYAFDQGLTVEPVSVAAMFPAAT